MECEWENFIDIQVLVTLNISKVNSTYYTDCPCGFEGVKKVKSRILDDLKSFIVHGFGLGGSKRESVREEGRKCCFNVSRVGDSIDLQLQVSLTVT